MDIELNYVEEGAGFPLIFLHGNGEDHSYFSAQIAYFRSRYRVIAVDTRGHGATPRGEAPFTIRQFAEDLYGFLCRKGIERAHLLGFSDGANIAMCFALKHPERVAALILNGGNLDAGGIKRSVQIPIELGYRIARLFAEKSAEAKKNAELLGLMVNEPNIAATELSAVTAPALVIVGTRDMVRKKHTELIYRGLPNAELVSIRGNHFIANKHPGAFNEAVERFLESVKSE